MSPFTLQRVIGGVLLIGGLAGLPVVALLALQENDSSSIVVGIVLHVAQLALGGWLLYRARASRIERAPSRSGG